MVEPLPTECPHCSGKGWVVVADGGAGTARPCECRLLALGPRLLEASGLPARYRGCTLDNFRTDDPEPSAREQLQRALAESRHYVENFLTGQGTFVTEGLIFVGRAGSGKTHLAAAVALALVERYRVRCRFVEFTALVHQIQSTFDPQSAESSRQVLEPVMGAELLVLDELGAQRPTPFVQDLLYLIINTRYTERRPTIFTTNYQLEPSQVVRRKPRGFSDREVSQPDEASVDRDDPGFLGSRLQASLISRLHEMARLVVLNAPDDYRQRVKSASWRPVPR